VNSPLVLGRDEGADHVAMDDVGEVRLWDAAQERYAPPAGSGQPLVMDVEKARATLAQLAIVADDVAELGRDLTFRQVTPPGTDEVSRNVAAQSDRMITAGRAYLLSWHSDLVAGIAALSQQIDAYEDADRQNAMRA